MEPFISLSKCQIAICKTYRFACVANEVTTHLRVRHPSIPPTEQRRAVVNIQALPRIIRKQAELCELHYPPPNTDPIPYLAVPYTDGLRCRKVCYIACQVRKIQEQCRADLLPALSRRTARICRPDQGVQHCFGNKQHHSYRMEQGTLGAHGPPGGKHTYVHTYLTGSCKRKGSERYRLAETFHQQAPHFYACRDSSVNYVRLAAFETRRETLARPRGDAVSELDLDCDSPLSTSVNQCMNRGWNYNPFNYLPIITQRHSNFAKIKCRFLSNNT